MPEQSKVNEEAQHMFTGRVPRRGNSLCKIPVPEMYRAFEEFQEAFPLEAGKESQQQEIKDFAWAFGFHCESHDKVCSRVTIFVQIWREQFCFCAEER